MSIPLTIDIKGSFFPLTHHCLNWVKWWFLELSIPSALDVCTRLDWLHKEGREEGRSLWRWHTFAATPCLSQVNGLSPRYSWWISQPSGAVREIHYLGGESWWISRPKGKLAARTIHTPTHHRLSPHLPLLLGFSLRIRCWWNLEHVRWATRRHTDAMIGGKAQTLPKVCCLAHQFPLQGVKTF